MKPHSLRRVLWLTNVGLGVAVLGVLAWFVLEVRPKVAEAVDREDNYQPEELKQVFERYKTDLQTGLLWTPKPPVSKDELYAVILRADYAKKKHWIFSGPLPPEDKVDTGPIEEGPPPPEGLAAIGEVKQIVIDPSNRSTILFKFGPKKSRPFAVGDWVRESDDAPKRFKLTAIVEVRPRVFEVRYDIFGKDLEKPDEQGKLVWDTSPGKEPYPDFLGPVRKDGAGGAKKPDGGTGTSGNGIAEAGPKIDGDGDGDSDDCDVPAERVIEVGTKPAADLELKDLNPKVHRDPRNPNDRAICR